MGSRPAPIALIGLRRSGKSTWAPRLASALGCGWADLDAVLEAGFPCSVAEFLQRQGESAFRVAEARALEALLARTDRFVLATGGGVVETPSARESLRARSFALHLDPPLEVLIQRLADDPEPQTRPQLEGATPEEELRSQAARRDTWFQMVRKVWCPDAEPSLEGLLALLRPPASR